MRNAAIATSRTRHDTTADDPRMIDYRPLPELWGDVESLRTIRAIRSRAAARGIDPTILQIDSAELSLPTESSTSRRQESAQRGGLSRDRSDDRRDRRRGSRRGILWGRRSRPRRLATA